MGRPLHGGEHAFLRLVRTMTQWTSVTLNTLRPPLGATHSAKRVGRGSGSGKGHKSTRGTHGEKARAGNKKPVPGFEGGQTPLYRRIPKSGFTNAHAIPLVPLNLDTLQRFIDIGVLDPTQPITMAELWKHGIVGRNIKGGVKLVARGVQSFTAQVTLETTQASSAAIEAIERNGGSFTAVYYNRMLLKPEKFHPRLMPRFARPRGPWLSYYTRDETRGYLSPLVMRRTMQEERGNRRPPTTENTTKDHTSPIP